MFQEFKNERISKRNRKIYRDGQDISFVQKIETSIVEDIFKKQGLKGCNKITRAFKNSNNHNKENQKI